MANPIFEEEQRFIMGAWWILLGLVAAIPFVGIFMQLILGIPFGNNPMSDTGLIIFAALMILFLQFFAMLKLKTTITDEGIKARFFPLVNSYWSWENIEEAEVIDYGFVGGWGLRYGTKYGTVYNVSGSKGLLIRHKNGNKFVLGTQQPEMLKQALREHKHIPPVDLDELVPPTQKIKEKQKR